MAIIHMNTELFQQAVKEEKPALVEFWAPWCVYCRRIAPALGKLAEEYGDALTVGQVNIDEEPALAQQEKIELVPTMILFQGGEAKGSIVAPDSKAKIEALIQEHVGK